jgi:hypothetical protein
MHVLEDQMAAVYKDIQMFETKDWRSNGTSVRNFSFFVCDFCVSHDFTSHHNVEHNSMGFKGYMK